MKRLLPLTAALVVLVIASPALGEPEQLTALAERLRPSVVLLTIEDGRGNKVATGTGFFVSDDGRVVTNHHVIEGAGKIVASLNDGTNVDVAGVLADDEEDDIAILQVEGHGPWPPLTLGDSDVVKQGEDIVVIGAPMGLANTLTKGIVSNVRTGYEESNGGAHHRDSWRIQISAAVSPGSSGSPIMTGDGHVIAVAVGMVGADEHAQGLNFGVPINIPKHVLDSLPAKAKPKPFAAVRSDHLARNLIISASVVAGLAIFYFLWGWLESRRPRTKPRTN